MRHNREKVNLIILLSLALFIIPTLIISNQRYIEFSLDKKNDLSQKFSFIESSRFRWIMIKRRFQYRKFDFRHCLISAVFYYS